jgi:hypothetical protein
MKLFPLPPDEWVGPQKCTDCGGKPEFLLEDMKPICKKCIGIIMKEVIISTKKESHEEPSIPITMDAIANSRFEWSTDNEKWYSVKGKNIKTDRTDVFIRDLKKSIIEKRPLALEADYEKETKTLTITL